MEVVTMRKDIDDILNETHEAVIVGKGFSILKFKIKRNEQKVRY